METLRVTIRGGMRIDTMKLTKAQKKLLVSAAEREDGKMLGSSSGHAFNVAVRLCALGLATTIRVIETINGNVHDYGMFAITDAGRRCAKSYCWSDE